MCISFDLDGTIIKPDYNELIWFKEIPERYAQQHGVDLQRAKELVARAYERVGEDDLRWYILDYWLKYFGLVVEEREVLEKYADEVEAYDEALPVLEELKKEYRLIICSAMPRSFIDVKLRCGSLFRYFDRIFSAVSDFRMVKKESAFYQKVCETINIPTRKLVHIGDNYEADYLAPRQVHVTSFYLNRTCPNSSTNSHIVSNLLEFVHRLREKEKGDRFII